MPAGLVQGPDNKPDVAPRSPWSSGLFDCAAAPALCAYGACCAPCLYGNNYADMHDTGCAGACCMYTLCPCLSCYFAADTRTRLRDKYGLRPAPCSDYAAHCCCSPCALCQEARELRHQAAAGRGERVEQLQGPLQAPLRA